MQAETATYKKLCWLLLAALIVRIAFALTADNLHYPDENFQYLEQAHRLVFGYGIVPWEYRFGVRSWLLPFLLSVPLYVTKWLHLDSPGLYIPLIKCLLCLLSVSLIYSAWR